MLKTFIQDILVELRVFASKKPRKQIGINVSDEMIAILEFAKGFWKLF